MPLTLTALRGIPYVGPGEDLPALIWSALLESALTLQDSDIVVVAQKIVSKAEGRQVNLSSVGASPRARDVAAETGKDPRIVELILRESNRIVRMRSGTLIVEHRLGFVCANAGIDHSNVAGPANDKEEYVLLLPVDADASAARIRAGLESRSGRKVGVMIIDSHGRAWRLGTVGACIGLSGVPAVVDQRGWKDLFGYTLQATVIGVADELAAAASMVMGQAAEGTPVVHVRGFPYPLEEGHLADLLRPASEDLFR